MEKAKVKEIKLISANNPFDFNCLLERNMKSGFIPSGELVVNTCYHEGMNKIDVTYSIVMAKY